MPDSGQKPRTLGTTESRLVIRGPEEGGCRGRGPGGDTLKEFQGMHVLAFSEPLFLHLPFCRLKSAFTLLCTGNQTEDSVLARHAVCH